MCRAKKVKEKANTFICPTASECASWGRNSLPRVAVGSIKETPEAKIKESELKNIEGVIPKR